MAVRKQAPIIQARREIPENRPISPQKSSINTHSTHLSKVPELMIHLPPLPRLLAHPLLLFPTRTSTTAPPLPPQILSIKFIPRKPRTRRPPLTRRSHRHRPRSSIPSTSSVLHHTPPPQTPCNLLVIHHHHHPHSDFLVAAHHRRAVNPAGLALDVAGGGAEPGDFGRDAGAVRKGVEQAFADMLGAADAVEEFGLQEAGNAKGGRGKGYAEGGVGADEEVLFLGEC